MAKNQAIIKEGKNLFVSKQNSRLMYSADEIFEGMRHPARATKHILKRYNHLNKRYNEEGTYIFAEDWDNLVILDACRYDYFSKNIEFKGELEYRISRGSFSGEFIRGNFQGSNLYDTVYCSHNWWYQKIFEELGSERSDVFRYEAPDRTDYRELGHVRARSNNLTELALRFQEKYPNKRLIIHYMSPHEPYVDEDGNILLEVNQFAKEGERKYPDTFYDLIHRDSARDRYVSKKEIREAYDSSVRYILGHIRSLLEELEGLTVITADHGELLGERMFPFPFIGYRHPEGVYMNELVKVPWFKYYNGERKEVIDADEPHQSMEETKEVSDAVDEHLRNLGYKI